MTSLYVIPTQAGIQITYWYNNALMDPCFHWNDILKSYHGKIYSKNFCITDCIATLLQNSCTLAEKTPFNRDKDKGTSRFDFLGFEFYWGLDRKGKAHLKRRTSRKKLRKSIANFTEWCRSNRHMKLREFFRKLNQKLNQLGKIYFSVSMGFE